jgi:hypothetical protein
MRECRFAGTNFKPRELLENAATPTRRVHAVLGGFLALRLCLSFKNDIWFLRVPCFGGEYCPCFILG